MSDTASVPIDTRMREDVVPCSRVNPSPPCLVSSSSPPSSDSLRPLRSPRSLPRTKKRKKDPQKDESQGSPSSKQIMPPVSTILKETNRNYASESSHSSARKSNKPQMEKKRRQREKESLIKLREYILTAFKVDPSKYLDKAEILEKTVKLLHYIMVRHYSSDSRTSESEPKLFDNISSALIDKMNSDNKVNNGKQNTTNLVDLSLMNSESKFDHSYLSFPQKQINHPISKTDSVVTLYIPQTLINQPCLSTAETPLLSNNNMSVDLKTPVMQLVVNNNYYGNQRGIPSSPECSSSCEVSSSDSSSNETQIEDSSSVNSTSNFQNLPDNCESLKKVYLPNITSMKNKAIPLIKNDPALYKKKLFSGQRLIAPKPSLNTNSNLHRPWE